MSRRSILVVEDNSGEREMLRRFFAAEGYEVSLFASGEEAAGHIGSTGMDLVLTDLRLPGIDGLEVARRFLAADPDRPVILMTAFGEIHDASEAVSLGISAFVLKPFDLQVLRNAVDRAIDHRMLVLQNRGYQKDLEQIVERRTAELERAHEKLQREVSEQRRMLGALRASEARFRQLAENIPQVFWIVDPRQPDVLYISPAYEEIWGRSCVSLHENPTSFLDAIHPEDRSRVAASLERQLKGEYTEDEYRVVHPDGAIRWVWDQAFPIRNEEGQVYRVAGIAEDITERVRAGELMRVRTEQLVAVTDAMTVFLETGSWNRATGILLRGALDLTESDRGLIGLLAGDGKLNVLAREGFAESPDAYLDIEGGDSLLGETISSLRAVVSNSETGVIAPGLPPVRRFMGIPVAGRRGVVGMVAVMDSKNPYSPSERHRLEAIVHAVGVLFDSYSRQESQSLLERQLQQAQKMEAIGTLAGGIAHDFNNLLTSIIGGAQLALLQSETSTSWREYVGEIPETGKQAAKLISQLLAFSRKAVSESQNLSLASLVKETFKLLERTLPESVDLQLVVEGGIPEVTADPVQIQQVLMNLAVNASHAMPQGGRLTVVLEDAPPQEAPDGSCKRLVCLRIRDTGMGMTPDVMKHVFEPFFTTKEPGKGTGLGLATAQSIVKEHGGHITVSSQVGRGTEFTVYFPAATPETSARTDSGMGECPGGTETVLLVEDAESALKVARQMLERLGYQVLTARDGKEALSIYSGRRDSIDLVLTDMVMPRMGALEFVRRLRAEECSAAILLMSGYALKEEVEELKRQGASGFIAKPFDFASLAAAVRQSLDAARSFRGSR